MTGTQRLFKSFFQGGIECSTHRRRSGKRLDLIASTQHDVFAHEDYRRCHEYGLHTLRSGLRWHLIDRSGGELDFSPDLPRILAARDMDMQVIWDLVHFGWPDDVDVFSPEFIRRLSAFATAFAKLLKSETDAVPFICPINEISFLSWAGGDVGIFNPFATGRGFELKMQLARAAIEATEAVWSVWPQARIVHVDPVIHIVADPERPGDRGDAEGRRLAQYQGWDLLTGRLEPQLGGHPRYLDIIGANYYPTNQWILHGPQMEIGDPLYKPFRDILSEVHGRYGRPMMISETGAEDDLRSRWLRYIATETAAAIRAGLPIEGLCWYPLMNHHGWDNDRHCHNGLWDMCDDDGRRHIHVPLAAELNEARRIIFDARPPAARVHAPTQPISGVASAAAGRHEGHENMSQPAQTSNGSGKGNGKADGNSRHNGPAARPDRLRICLFTDSLEASGMGEHMLVLAHALRQRHEVALVMPRTPHNAPFIERARKDGMTCLPLEVRDAGGDAARELRTYLAEKPFDVFHGHAGIGWEGHAGCDQAHRAGIAACVRTEHLPYKLTDPRQQAEYHAHIERVHRVICVSAESRDTYLAAGLPARKLAVVRNGIPIDAVTDCVPCSRAALGLPANARMVLTPGRMTEQKGHAYLLDAVPDVLARVPDAHFVWAGDGPLMTHLAERIQTTQLSRRVHLLGWRNDVPGLLSAADLLVLPSLFEGLPIVILEAMAAGLPIVATDVGGTHEAVSDGVHGRLVPPAQPQALADAVAEALLQPERSSGWAQAARQRAETEFSADRMARETEVVYSDALAHAARVRATMPKTPRVLTSKAASKQIRPASSTVHHA